MICVIGIIVSSIPVKAQEVEVLPVSTTSQYTYSVGGVNEEGHDFTPNVEYSATIFGLMDSVTNAYKNFYPTIDYLKGNNPGGYKRLGSKIVLLTGHSNASQIILDNGSNLVGVNKTNSFTADSGRKYVGLNTISMDNTDLVMFFGCQTAVGDSNLCTASVGRGADVAVGTSISVVSRAGEGATWVQRFIDGLYYGKSIIEAGAYADTFVSATNSMRMGWTYVGDGSKIVNPVSENTLTLQYNNTILPYNDSIVEMDIEIEIIDFVSNLVSEKATEYSGMLEDVIAYVTMIDDSFDLTNYRVSTKMFDDNNGILSLEYFIGGDIATEKGFTFIYENGILTSVTYNKEFYNTASMRSNLTNEKELIEIMKQHKANMPVDLTNNDKETNSRDYYSYSFESNELKHIQEIFTFNGEVWLSDLVENPIN